MVIKLPSWVYAVIGAASGSATRDAIKAFLEGGLKDAIACLLRGDIAGFITALPEQIRQQVQAYINGEVATAIAKASSVLPASVAPVATAIIGSVEASHYPAAAIA